MTIHITSKEKETIERILEGIEFVYFGSRTKGTHHPFSDLDICIKSSPFTLDRLAKITRAFSESDLPFKVDVVVYGNLDDTFKELIDKEGIKT